MYLKVIVLPQLPSTNSGELGLTLSTIKPQFIIADLKKFGIIATRIIDNLFSSNNWNIVWAILLISLINIRNTRYMNESKLLISFLGLSLGMFYFGFTLTQHFYWAAETDDVISRGLLHIYPIATMLIILINFSNRSNSEFERIV
jgi:hypothetical protein